MWQRRARVMLLAMLAISLTGCNIVRALAYVFAPPQIAKAEFKLTPGRLAVLVEYALPEEENPLFTDALCTQLERVFREQKLKTQLVPQSELRQLRQTHPDAGTWSLQRVAREVNADQILSIRVDRLQIREEPGSPLLQPYVRMRLKVIGRHEPPDAARLWPDLVQERDGRVVESSRQPLGATDSIAIDAEASKLGTQAAWDVASFFYDRNLEQTPPRES